MTDEELREGLIQTVRAMNEYYDSRAYVFIANPAQKEKIDFAIAGLGKQFDIRVLCDAAVEPGKVYIMKRSEIEPWRQIKFVADNDSEWHTCDQQSF